MKTLEMEFWRTALSVSFPLTFLFHFCTFFTPDIAEPPVMASVSAEQQEMLQQSVPLPTMATQGETKGLCSDSAGTLQAQMWSNPSWNAATTYGFFPVLSTSLAPCVGRCSHVRKLFALFLLKEWWFSLLNRGTERLGSLWSSHSCSCRSSEELHRDTALCAPECYPHTPVLCFLQTFSVCVFPHFPHSQSKSSQCEEALLKIQMLPLPLPDFEALSWGPVNCIPF